MYNKVVFDSLPALTLHWSTGGVNLIEGSERLRDDVSDLLIKRSLHE